MATITTAFLFMVVSAVVVSLSEMSGSGANGQNASWIALMSLLCFSFTFTILKLGEIATIRFKKFKKTIYAITAAMFSLSTLLVRQILSSDATPQYWRQPISHVRLFIVVGLIFYILHATLGMASFRISEEAREAKEAKAALEIQRSRLIDSQEETRKEIADFLHDRLQSDLVVLGMQINKAVESMEPDIKEVAHAFIDEIERIRQIDVREASRALAPELDGPAITPALNDLIRHYESIIDIQLAVDQQEKTTKQQRLAIYRIVEQALLNAAKHASPSQINIEIAIGAQLITIRVTNDGRELSPEFVAGSGFAIIDTWVKQYRGEWSVQADDRATTLWAELKTAK